MSVIRRTGKSRTLTLSATATVRVLDTWANRDGASIIVGAAGPGFTAIEAIGYTMFGPHINARGVDAYSTTGAETYTLTETTTLTLYEAIEYDGADNELRVFEQFLTDASGNAGNTAWALSGSWAGSGNADALTGYTPSTYEEYFALSLIGGDINYEGYFPDSANGLQAGEVASISWTGGDQDLWPAGEAGLDRIVEGTSSGSPVTIADWTCTASSTSLVLVNPGSALDSEWASVADNRRTIETTTANFSGTIYRCGDVDNSDGSARLGGYAAVEMECSACVLEGLDGYFTSGMGGYFIHSHLLKCQKRATTQYDTYPTYTDMGNWTLGDPVYVRLRSDWCETEGQYYLRSQWDNSSNVFITLDTDHSINLTDPTGNLPEWEAGVLDLATSHDLDMMHGDVTWASTGAETVTITESSGRKRLSVGAGGTGEVTVTIDHDDPLGIALGYRYFQFCVRPGSGSIDGDTLTIDIHGFTRGVRSGDDTPIPSPWDPIEEYDADLTATVVLAENPGHNVPVRVTKSGDDYTIRIDALLCGGEIHKVETMTIGGLVASHVYDVEPLAGIVPLGPGGQPLYPDACAHSVMQSYTWPAPDSSRIHLQHVWDTVGGDPVARTATVYGRPLHWLSFHGIPFSRVHWERLTDPAAGGILPFPYIQETETLAGIFTELDRWLEFEGDYGGLVPLKSVDPESGGSAIRTDTCVAWWLRPRLNEQATASSSGRFIALPQWAEVVVYPGATHNFTGIEKVLGAAIPCWVENDTPTPNEAASGIEIKARKLTEAATWRSWADVVDGGNATLAGLLPTSEASGRWDTPGDPPPEGTLTEDPPGTWTLDVDTTHVIGGDLPAEYPPSGGILTPPRVIAWASLLGEVEPESGAAGPDLEINDWTLQFVAYELAGNVMLKRRIAHTWETLAVCEGEGPCIQYSHYDQSGPLVLAYEYDGTIYRRTTSDEGGSWTVAAAYKTSAGADVTGTNPMLKIDPITGQELLAVHNGTGFVLYRYNRANSDNALEAAITMVATAPAGRISIDSAKDAGHTFVGVYADASGVIQRITSANQGKTWA